MLQAEALGTCFHLSSGSLGNFCTVPRLRSWSQRSRSTVTLKLLFSFLLLCFVLCFVVASPRGFASSFGVWEWESRRGAFCCLVSQLGDFRMVGVARLMLRAVRLICLKPDWLVCTSSVPVHHLSFLRYDSFAPLQAKASMLHDKTQYCLCDGRWSKCKMVRFCGSHCSMPPPWLHCVIGNGAIKFNDNELVQDSEHAIYRHNLALLA